MNPMKITKIQKCKIKSIGLQILMQKSILQDQRRNINLISNSDTTAITKLKTIAMLSAIFMTVQILGGLLANSIAILADALHLLSDILAYCISLWAVIMSNKQATQRLSFGYEKIQPLGALINVAIIWVVTVFLFIEATNRIWQKQIVQEPFYMFLTSIFGLGCNLTIMKVLHSDQNDGNRCSHNNQSQKIKLSQDQKKNRIDQSLNQYQIQQVHHYKDQTFGQGQNSKTHKKHQQSVDSRQIRQNSLQYTKLISQSKQPEFSQSQNYKQKLKDANQNFLSHNINLQAAYIHIISDIILSIGIIFSSTIIYFLAQKKVWNLWQLADPFLHLYIFNSGHILHDINNKKIMHIVIRWMPRLISNSSNLNLIHKTGWNLKNQQPKNMECKERELQWLCKNHMQFIQFINPKTTTIFMSIDFQKIQH